jgi:hypothetical protein
MNMDELPEWEALIRKNMRTRIRLLFLVTIVILTLLVSEELFDLPYLLFGSLPTPVNYYELVIEGMLLLALLASLLVYYRSELERHIECSRKMHERMENEYRVSQKLEVEKELSARLLSLGYKYHHECQTPLVTLGGYFESINDMQCDIIDCPVIEDRDVIVKNIRTLYAINKDMADELNHLSRTLDRPETAPIN